MAAGRGQLHQHQQQVGHEQADARGQHGASRARQPLAGSGQGARAGFKALGAGATLAPAGCGQRACSRGWRSLDAGGHGHERRSPRAGARACALRVAPAALGLAAATAGWMPEPGPWEFPL